MDASAAPGRMGSIEQYIAEVRIELESCLAESYPEHEEVGSIELTYAAMRYMVFLGGGGKRIRPVLTMLASDACGGDRSVALQFAQAVEEIHTYTLILDDIQDQDVTRRGHDACHIRFGTNTALLAAQRLYERGLEPFHRLKNSDAVEVRRLLDLLHRGQAADLQTWPDERITKDSLEFIHAGKTSALIQLSLLGGSVAAGASNSQKEALVNFGYYLGLAFQGRDDVLSASSTEAAIGKPAGKNADRGRLTSPRLAGSPESAQALAVTLSEKACKCLTEQGLSTFSLFQDIAQYAVKRVR